LRKTFSREEYAQLHKKLDESELRFLKFRFAQCPIRTSIGAIGKKWSLLVLWHVGVYGIDRFNRLLEVLPGISPSVLATRLKELEKDGLMSPVERRKSHPMMFRWALTDRGIDTLPILMMIVAYGSKYKAEVFFDDKQPRKLHELFDDEGMDLIRRTL